MSFPGPLYMPPRIHSLLKSNWCPFCHLAMGKESERGTKAPKKEVVHCEACYIDYQQAAWVGALRAAGINSSLMLAQVPPLWGGTGVATPARSADWGHGWCLCSLAPALYLDAYSEWMGEPQQSTPYTQCHSCVIYRIGQHINLLQKWGIVGSWSVRKQWDKFFTANKWLACLFLTSLHSILSPYLPGAIHWQTAEDKTTDFALQKPYQDGHCLFVTMIFYQKQWLLHQSRSL